MKTPCFLIVVLALGATLGRAELPSDEAGVIALFEKAGARISTDDEGHAVKLFSGGKPPHSVEELQLIGLLSRLEELALNAPQAGDGDWQFLHRLPRLRQLTIWHGKHFSSLAPFRKLPIEGLTVGGCMGIRDLNQGAIDKQRDVVMTLKDLPNLKRLNLYHSPTASDDSHLIHLARAFPMLVDLKLDFKAPRDAEASITPAGLAHLQPLPITVLSAENVDAFTPAHIEAIAGIETLEAFLIDVRKSPIDTTPLVEAMKQARPDVEVVVADENSTGPPRRSRKP